MHYRISPPFLLLLVALLGSLVLFFHLGILALSFARLGLSPHGALLLVSASMFGSLLNLPIARIRSRQPPNLQIRTPFGLLRIREWSRPGYTILAVNVGGCLIPVGFCAYLYNAFPLNAIDLGTGVLLVTLISYTLSRPVPGMGIAMPFFVGPFSAAAIGIWLGDDHQAPFAYISGSLGVLLGADLLRLPDIRRMGGPIASIGGAGTFDGIFLTGLMAALLT